MKKLLLFSLIGTLSFSTITFAGDLSTSLWDNKDIQVEESVEQELDYIIYDSYGNLNAELLSDLKNTSSIVELKNGTLTEVSAFANHFAFLDLYSASDEVKELIKDARNEIIFNNEWCIDGTTFISDGETGEVLRVLPKFHDIFPNDWHAGGYFNWDMMDY